jgi:hypothetical protein
VAAIVVQAVSEVFFVTWCPSGNLDGHQVMFSIRKRGIFRHGKEIKGLRGGVHKYAAQASPQIDTARTEKDRFRMKTTLIEEWD